MKSSEKAIMYPTGALRQKLRRPGVGVRLTAAALTAVGLLPSLLRLPQVTVVACFDSGHPLYQWVPSTAVFTGDVHCVTAPATTVSWTLMIASTLLVQLVLLPLILTAGAILIRGTRRLAASAGKALARPLAQLSALVFPDLRPALAYAPVRYQAIGLAEENPRRGPPNCLS